MTLDAKSANLREIEHGWLHRYELYCVCRNCSKSSILWISQKEYDDTEFLQDNSPVKFGESLNQHFTVDRYISLSDNAGTAPPDYLPDPIRIVFTKGATSVATNCWNAAGAMFRKCIDLATVPMLPPEEPAIEGLNAKVRRDLGLRLPWLFDNNALPADLRGLASCIHQDGNDAAHSQFLKKEDAEELLDFTVALLERLFTEPERIRLAEERRKKRREPAQGKG
jgi:Domain of unknown function (DUF4145)